MVNPVDPNAQSCQGQALPQSAAEAILRQLPLTVELWFELDKPTLQGDWERTL